MNSNFEFKNLNEILDSVVYRVKDYGFKLINVNIDSTHVHIEFNQWIGSNNDVIDFFNDIETAIVCAQDICAPMTITNHIIEERYLDVGEIIEVNYIVNRRFDKDDYK